MVRYVHGVARVSVGHRREQRAQRLQEVQVCAGIEVGGRRIESGDCSGPQSARMVLLNPRVEAAALETARGGILREGLGFDLCDVGIVTNIGEGDHLGLAEIETPERLAWVKRTVIDVAARNGKPGSPQSEKSVGGHPKDMPDAWPPLTGEPLRVAITRPVHGARIPRVQ